LWRIPDNRVETLFYVFTKPLLSTKFTPPAFLYPVTSRSYPPSQDKPRRIETRKRVIERPRGWISSSSNPHQHLIRQVYERSEDRMEQKSTEEEKINIKLVYYSRLKDKLRREEKRKVQREDK
jgi:hypothetical protein